MEMQQCIWLWNSSLFNLRKFEVNNHNDPVETLSRQDFGGKMKSSNYNFFYALDGREDFLAYNAISHGLCLIDQPVKEMLENWNDQPETEIQPALLDQLKYGHFLLDDDFSELNLLRNRQYMAQYNNNTLSLTIAPTINCNLACPYCFESHIKGKMTRSVINGIASFVENQLNMKMFGVVSVTWYGGEPLLYPDVIDTLSTQLIAICDAQKVAYEASIITNGTRLTTQVAAMLKKHRVSSAQITIDGDKLTHDCRRVNKGGGGSFDKIIDNISKIVGILPISVRINVDRTNVDFAVKTYEYFKAQDWYQPDVINFYFGWVRKFTEAVEAFDEDVLTPEEFHAKAEAFKKTLISEGLMEPEFPQSYKGCVATNVNGFVIGPRGGLWKCWSVIGEEDKKFGNVLDDTHVPNAHYLEYMSESWESDSECRSCKVLPICMGGCSDIRINRNNGRIDHKDCGTWRYNIEDKLRTRFSKLLEDQDELDEEAYSEDLPFAVPMDV
jgi:uncharacterized protein